MKQLSSSELNNLSKEDLAAMVLQMQQLQQEMQQTQLQLQQQISTLNEKIAIMNARHFGRSTEKLSTLPGQMNIFNEADAAAAEAIAEPARVSLVSWCRMHSAAIRCWIKRNRIFGCILLGTCQERLRRCTEGIEGGRQGSGP